MEYATCSDFPNRLETQDLSLKWTEIKHSCLSHDLDCKFDKIFSVKLHKRFISICITTILSSPSFSDTSYKVWRKKLWLIKNMPKRKYFRINCILLFEKIICVHVCVDQAILGPLGSAINWIENNSSVGTTMLFRSVE